MAIDTTDKTELEINAGYQDAKIDELLRRLSLVESRLSAIESWKATGLTNDSNYVCDSDDTYDGTTSKQLTVTNGLITNIET